MRQAMNRDYNDIETFISHLDAAYALKARRLNFMNLASVNRQILLLRDGFEVLWEREGGMFRLFSPELSGPDLEILTGIFAEPEQAQLILDSCREVLAVDRVRFDQFLAERVSSAVAVRNLYGIFYGPGQSIERLVREQVPYLEKYIPTFRSIASTELPALRLDQSDIDTIRDIILLFDRIKENFTADIALYKKFRKDYRQRLP